MKGVATVLPSKEQALNYCTRKLRHWMLISCVLWKQRYRFITPTRHVAGRTINRLETRELLARGRPCLLWSHVSLA